VKKREERTTDKRRKAKKHERGWHLPQRGPFRLQERERKGEGHSRQEVVSRVFPRRLFSKQELLLPLMRHAEGCAPAMEIPRERWSLLAAMGDAPILVS